MTDLAAPAPDTAAAEARPGDGPALDGAVERLVGRVDDTSLRRFLRGLPGVDEVGANARAAKFGTRSIKTDSKAWGLDAVVSMIDLTTLEGADTPGKVRTLAAKAANPDPATGCPPVAAVCVYGDLVADVADALDRVGALWRRPPAGDERPGVRIAAVATAFPSGRASTKVRLLDTADAVAAGAHEIDMVIDRGAFLAGRWLEVFEDVVAVRAACARPDGSRAKLKVILETGELATYDNVRRASWLAMLAGADTIKTSTGKVSPAATMPVTLVMLEAIRDFHLATGLVVGMKPAGGIRTAKDALRYLVMVQETLGPGWLHPDRFRFGASSLLNDVLMQRQKLRTGAYSGADYVSID
ncbi:deoxyribose-phosphate aldolase [Aquipuribacter nitratireducens]|uniref:Deoxyribose-phosphate aldolase n=1 Tax=Aquipuribacter nitratireducens TaxID=650104 RepID=A0ABW0GL43_9MICO